MLCNESEELAHIEWELSREPRTKLPITSLFSVYRRFTPFTVGVWVAERSKLEEKKSFYGSILYLWKLLSNWLSSGVFWPIARCCWGVCRLPFCLQETACPDRRTDASLNSRQRHFSSSYYSIFGFVRHPGCLKLICEVSTTFSSLKLKVIWSLSQLFLALF